MRIMLGSNTTVGTLAASTFLTVIAAGTIPAGLATAASLLGKKRFQKLLTTQRERKSSDDLLCFRMAIGPVDHASTRALRYLGDVKTSLDEAASWRMKNGIDPGATKDIYMMIYNDLYKYGFEQVKEFRAWHRSLSARISDSDISTIVNGGVHQLRREWLIPTQQRLQSLTSALYARLEQVRQKTRSLEEQNWRLYNGWVVFDCETEKAIEALNDALMNMEVRMNEQVIGRKILSFP